MTSPLRAESSPLVGSSRNNILGLVIRRLAIESLFFWPPLRPFLRGVPTMVPDLECRPKLAIRSSTRRKASLRETLLCDVRNYLSKFCREQNLGRESLAAKTMVSRTVMLPIKASSCST